MSNLDEVEILLVEDSEEDAELAIRELRRQNLANRLYHVEDGAAALDFIFARGQYADRSANYRPKIVLLDLKLPKRSGLEVLQELRNDDRTRTLPVVVMTSSREDTDLQKAYELGVNSYVVKPVDFEQFSKVVGDLGLYWLVLNESPVSG